MKRTNKQSKYALLLAFIMLCSCLIIPTSATVEAAGTNKLKVTSAKTVVVGKTIKIKTNVKAKFKSSNKKIATVSSKGVVKGKKAGKVKITVTSKSNKKQKKVIKITVKKKQKAAATTEKPTPAPNPKPTTETPTTEAPTTEKPTTEAPTTEKPTTEAPVERKVVGIEANYRGSKVPNDNYSMRKYGIDVNLIYQDGTKEKVGSDYRFQLKSISNNIATYEVTSKGYSTNFSVELVDTKKIYPYQLSVEYTGQPINKGDNPKLEDLDVSIIMNDIETTISDKEIDKSNIKITFLGYEEDNKGRYIISYDYIFTDENGNELFVCVFDNVYVPYE